MSDNATAETPPSDEPQPAAPVADAHANQAISEPTASTEEQAEVPASEPAEPEVEVSQPAAPVTTDDWSSVPESELVAEKPAKKSKSRAKKAEEPAEEAPAASDELPAAATPEGGAEAATDSASEEAPTDGVTDSEVSAEPEPPENKKKWYAIKVQSGREDTIKAAILRKVAIEGLEDVFGQIMVPVDKVIEKRAVKVKDKKTGEYTTVERKVERKVKKFQGYIFAEIEFNDRMLYLIRETSGVGDFLKIRNKKDALPVPEPMTDAEVKQMLGEKVGPDSGGPKKVKIEFDKGDRVRIREGSFKDSEGEVKEVILPKDPTDPPKVKVTVTFWGRPLDVELEYWQVVKA